MLLFLSALAFVLAPGSSAIAVTQSGTVEGDIEPPSLTDFELNPAAVVVGSEDQSVEITARAADNLSGVSSIAVAVTSPDGKQETSTTLTRAGGTDNEAVFVGVFTFQQFAAGGVWRISNLSLRDNAGNSRSVSFLELHEAGFPYLIQVTWEFEEPDTRMPTLAGLSIEPDAIDTAAEPQTVSLIAHVVDQSSVNKMVFTFESPSGEVTVSGGQFIGISGSPLDGFYEIPVTFPQGSETGVWNISAVQLRDKNMNEGEISRAGLEAAGLPHSVMVSGNVPAVSLTATPSPSIYGQKVTFTAKVEPPLGGLLTPQGTVAFVEGETTLGVASLEKGTATFSSSSLGSGDHPIIAVYGGDSNFGIANSAILTQTVRKASTEVTVTSSLEPAPVGSAARLKATVKAVAPGAGTPTGTITFREGQTVLATVQLNGASAAYSLKGLFPGPHVITASYSGDSNNQPSQSKPLLQTIGLGPRKASAMR